MELTTQASHQHDYGDFDAFVRRISNRFPLITDPVFETDATGLYTAYLESFNDPATRQYHTCSCCRQFIERFGALATVDDAGHLVPIWSEDDAPEHYKAGVAAMARLVRRASITMPFLSSETMYGTPVAGRRDDGDSWTHFAIMPAPERVYRGTPLKNAFQAACEKREELASVITALGEYSSATCATALQLLKNDQLGNSEAVLGQAQFLVDLHALRDAAPRDRTGDARRNITWRAVATAPSGFCHPRSSMIATLLDDIAAGKTFEQAQAAWNKKMHPLQYQRPQAAPTAGAIAATEKAFEALGAASALLRRYASMADVLEKLWEPKAPRAAAAPASGIFASVKAKGTEPQPMSMRAPGVTMTWDKFARTVLPGAEAIELFVQSGRDSYAALTTAVDPDAYPIHQWDSAERRNPVAYFLYNGGSYPEGFNLVSGKFHKVTAITAKPHQWAGGKFEHHGEGVLLVIEGARDTRHAAGGSALFPSNMKGELHGYRAVIEGFSKTNQLAGHDGEQVCGLMLSKGSSYHTHLRVTSAGQTTEYKIDRWD